MIDIQVDDELCCLNGSHSLRECSPTRHECASDAHPSSLLERRFALLPNPLWRLCWYHYIAEPMYTLANIFNWNFLLVWPLPHMRRPFALTRPVPHPHWRRSTKIRNSSFPDSLAQSMCFKAYIEISGLQHSAYRFSPVPY